MGAVYKETVMVVSLLVAALFFWLTLWAMRKFVL